MDAKTKGEETGAGGTTALTDVLLFARIEGVCRLTKTALLPFATAGAGGEPSGLFGCTLLPSPSPDPIADVAAFDAPGGLGPCKGEEADKTPPIAAGTAGGCGLCTTGPLGTKGWACRLATPPVVSSGVKVSRFFSLFFVLGSKKPRSPLPGLVVGGAGARAGVEPTIRLGTWAGFCANRSD